MAAKLNKILRSRMARFLYWLAVLNWVDLAARYGAAFAFDVAGLEERAGHMSRKRSFGRTRALFVKMDGVGDYVIWSTTFGRLRELYPDDKYERILIGNERWKELAEDEPTFHEKIFVDADRFVLSPTYRYSLMKRATKLMPDVAMNARSSPDFLWGDSIIRISGARERLGSVGVPTMTNGIQEWFSRRWYTRLTRAPTKGEHELVTALRLLGVPEKDAAASVNIGRRSAGGRAVESYAVFFLGAYKNDKRWPVENFGKVADFVSATYGLKVVICGGPGEEHLRSSFKSRFRGEVEDRIGSTLLSEVRRILENAQLVITNDTGPAHMAVLSGVQTVVIAPGQEIGRYFPYPKSTGVMLRSVFSAHVPCVNCSKGCVAAEDVRPCIRQVTVESVLAAVADLMMESER